MNPLRLLILAVLCYILYRLLTGDGKRVEKGGSSRLESRDVLVEDPVCKVCVPKKQAFSLEEHGKTTYFCSDECRKKFINGKGE
ncbi:MAG: YHS domain-containing protein [Desulfobulbales bacterium]|nr:YHS domain-containing protein [Desulfobulbales bacterium]